MALALTVDKIDAVPEALRTLYAEHEGKFKLQVDGLEDTTGLKTALEKERQAVKDAKAASKQALADALKPYEGLGDPVKVRELMAQFEDADEAKLIAQGKSGVDQIIAKRTEKQRVQLQKEVDAAKAAEKAAQGVAETFKSRVLDNHIRAAAAKAGLHPFAVEDALLRARAIFSLNDKGDAIQAGADGAPVLGKDGKTSFGPAEWLDAMKESAPHWFPAGGSGGGAGGSGGAGAGGKTITRAAFDSLSTAEKSKAAKTLTIVD